MLGYSIGCFLFAAFEVASAFYTVSPNFVMATFVIICTLLVLAAAGADIVMAIIMWVNFVAPRKLAVMPGGGAAAGVGRRALGRRQAQDDTAIELQPILDSKTHF